MYRMAVSDLESSGEQTALILDSRFKISTAHSEVYPELPLCERYKIIKIKYNFKLNTNPDISKAQIKISTSKVEIRIK